MHASLKKILENTLKYVPHLQKRKYKNISMGMSNDYKEAIICGSNNVRIGSLIFGERED